MTAQAAPVGRTHYARRTSRHAPGAEAGPDPAAGAADRNSRVGDLNPMAEPGVAGAVRLPPGLRGMAPRNPCEGEVFAERKGLRLAGARGRETRNQRGQLT